MDQQEPFEIQQWQMARPTPGMHEHLSVPQAGDCLFRAQLCGKDPGVQVGRGRGIFLSGEAGGPGLVLPGEDIASWNMTAAPQGCGDVME